MNIEFTNHAEYKLALLKAHGFKIDRDRVKDVIKKPDSVKKGKKAVKLHKKLLTKLI